jgi:hypothetical protein
MTPFFGMAKIALVSLAAKSFYFKINEISSSETPILDDLRGLKSSFVWITLPLMERPDYWMFSHYNQC